MKKFLVIFMCLFLLCACNNNEDDDVIEVASIKRIQCGDISGIDGAVLIDVRTDEEYETGHLDNAINVSSAVIKYSIKGHVSDLETPIIVYCQSGRRSAESANILVNLGYKNVYDLGSINNCGEEN